MLVLFLAHHGLVGGRVAGGRRILSRHESFLHLLHFELVLQFGFVLVFNQLLHLLGVLGTETVVLVAQLIQLGLQSAHFVSLTLQLVLKLI